MKRVMINGRWPLNLPDHRADRPEWSYWEATRLAAMHHFIEPGDVVYDVGAEAGDFSALFATWGAKVALIEPNPKAWPTIRAVWEMNGLDPFWNVVGMLSDDPKRRDDAVSAYRFGWPDESRNDIDPAHGFYHIGEGDHPTVGLDALVEWIIAGDPDVVTMDVEGGEGHVLRGATRTLTEIKPAVFASLHPQFMRDLYGEDVNDIHALMKGHGYHGRFLCEDHEIHYVWTHPDSGRMFPGVADDYYIHENNPRKVF